MFKSQTVRASRNSHLSDEPPIIDPLRPTRRMLLSTTYGINYSFSTTVSVGYSLVGERFEPIVQFSGQGGSVIAMRAEIWWKFLNALNDINKYLAKPTPTDYSPDISTDTTPVDLNGYTVSFILAHGSRAIKISEPAELWKKEEDRTTDDETSAYNRPSFKKRKLYSPSIVLQKTSMDGLNAIIPCVSDHLYHLSNHVVAVNDSKEDIVRELTTLANAFGFVDTPLERFTELVLKDFDEMHEVLKRNFEPNFATNMYKTVMLELKALFDVAIAKEIKANIDSTRIYRR